jgi:predicted nucleotidyltransferase
LRHGPWPKPIGERLVSALDALVQRLRERSEIAGVILFGSYARLEQGHSSDVDLLILLDGMADPALTDAGRRALRLVGEIEFEYRLPMHLAPLLGSVDRPEDLGPDLLHAVWADGIILYARAGALVRLAFPGLTPWTLVRFTVARAPAADRVRLSRRLHGVAGRPGLIRSPGLTLGPGALLVPADQQRAIRNALDEAGAMYDLIPIWREA